MAVVSSIARSAGEVGLRGCAGLTLAWLLVSLAAPAVLAADPAAEDQVARLDRLSTTLGDLKSSLVAIREGLEGMRPTSEPAAWSPPDASCALPAKSSGEPEVTAGELEQLRSERGALKDRIAELEQAIKEARTSEVVAALVKRPSAAPIETAAAAEPKAPPRAGAVLKASKPAGGDEAGAAAAPAGGDGGAHLQLRADLALAQLRIAELSDQLQSTRANQAALEAELRSLRSLTDAKIKRFMGWQ